MIERHIQTFYQNMMGNELKVTPRQEEIKLPPYFNSDKIPKRMTKHRTLEVTWKLLEDREDTPGLMKDISQNAKRDSKERALNPRQSKTTFDKSLSKDSIKPGTPATRASVSAGKKKQGR